MTNLSPGSIGCGSAASAPEVAHLEGEQWWCAALASPGQSRPQRFSTHGSSPQAALARATAGRAGLMIKPLPGKHALFPEFHEYGDV